MIDKPQLPSYLDNIKVVLSRTSHPANIGSAARAMKTMGLTHLVLVAPNLMSTPMTPEPPIFHSDHPHNHNFQLPEESFVLASRARDILEQAPIVAHLDEALADVVISCALTSRRRELTTPIQTPRELAPILIQRAQAGQKIALVFGNETFGLSIEEVGQCNRLMTINGNPNYFSLNLAQAVQVVTYELFTHLDVAMDYLQPDTHLATHEQTEGMVRHLQAVMEDVGFFNRRNKDRLMRHMGALFNRAEVTTEDIDILRGFFNTLTRRIHQDCE